MTVFGLGTKKAAKSGHQPAADEEAKLPLEQVESKQDAVGDHCMFCS